MDHNTKIFITGHTGMVGKTVLEYLISKGYKNLLTATSKELDLKNQLEVGNFFKSKKPEYVLHYAAKVGGIMANIESPATFLYDNLMINANIINSAFEHKVKKLLFLGSSCIYPRECPQPMKEEYMLTGPLEPTNEGYAISKIAGLKLCEYYNHQYKTDFITILPPNLYGDNEHYDEKHSHVLISLLHKIHAAKENSEKEITLWGTGSARREFIHVRDVARASEFFIQNISAEDMAGKFINVGTGVDISIKELAELIAKKLDFKGKLLWDRSKPDGMPQKLMDVSRMRAFKFEPKISLDEGIDLFIDYLFKK